MITEQELKSKCTPDIIKCMVELAEGFEWGSVDDIGNAKGLISVIVQNQNYSLNYPCFFPLLIHRAVEGLNKQNHPAGQYGIYIDREKVTFCNYRIGRNQEKVYRFYEYQPQSLTQAECANLHCLLDILDIYDTESRTQARQEAEPIS